MKVYLNTPENSLIIGWGFLPEYCVGDPKLPYVIHDEKKGVFIYSATKSVPVKKDH